MNNEELLKLVREFKENPSDDTRNRIIEEMYADIFDIAREQAPKLPEKYEISDLFNAAIISLLENLQDINTTNAEDMQHELFNIVESAIQHELMLSIGPPTQTFIDHDEAVQLQQDFQKKIKDIHKGENDEKKKGKQKPE